MAEIPKLILDYDASNYQSSAGKAIRFLIKELEAERKERQRLNDLLKFAAKEGIDLNEFIPE